MGLKKTTHSRVYTIDKPKIKRLAKKNNVNEAEIIHRLLKKVK